MKPSRGLARWARVAIGLASTAATLFLLWYELVEARARRPSEHARVTLASLPEFFADRELLMREPIFQPGGGRSNGGRLLGPIVRWIPAARERGTSTATAEAIERYTRRFPTVGMLRNAPEEESFERVEAWGDDFPRHVDDPLVRMGASGLPDLSEYDHWDIEEDSPRDFFYPRDAYELLLDGPVPETYVFRFWARLRLLAGLKDHEVVKAAKHVRHLARLLITTEDESSLATAVRLLRDEAIALAAARGHVGGYQAIPAEVLDAAERQLGGAIRGVIVPGLTHAALGRVLNLSAPGVCAALGSTLPRLHTVRHALASRHPGFYRALDSLAERPGSPCRIRKARAAWRMPDSSAELQAWNAPEHAMREISIADRLAKVVPVRIFHAVTAEEVAYGQLYRFAEAYPNVR